MPRRGPKLKGPVTEKEIKIFEQLCYIQCTLEEIARSFSVTKDTLILRIEEWYGEKFSTVFAAKKENGRISLRREQWQSAHERKSIPMQIFLGKQYLGQSDKAENKETTELVYSTKVGASGEIKSEIVSREEWEKQKNFDAKAILLEEQKKDKPVKKKTKTKATKKKAKTKS